MLEIALIVGVVVAVLFGICLTVFIKSYKDYRYEDQEPDVEEAPSVRRKKPAEEAPVREVKPRQDAKQSTRPEPKPEAKTETKAGTKTEPKTEAKAEAEPKAATKSVSREAKTVAAPGEAKSEVRSKTETAAEAAPVDLSATKIASREETLMLRNAARKALSEKNTPPTEGPDENPEEDDGASPKLVPVIIAVAAVVVVLCVAALVLVFSRGNVRGNVEQPETVSVTVQDIQLQTTLAGRVTNPDIATTMFAATGKVDLNVKEGDYVTKGSTIYTIDSENLQAHIDLLEEQLSSLTPERTETSSTSVTAPGAGTVTKLRVADGSNVESGDTIAEITGPAIHQVTVTLATRVSTGQSVSVLTNGKTYTGTVTAVSAVNPAPADSEDEDGDETSDDAKTDSEEDNPDQSKENQSDSDTDSDKNSNDTGVNKRPQGSDDDDTSSNKTLYQATVSFSGSEVGSTAYVTVSGNRSSGTVVKGRSTVTNVAARSSGKLDYNVSVGDSVSTGDTIARIETQRQVSSSASSFDRREVELEIEQLETELENYTVKAGADGYVQKLYLKDGENAAVGMNAVTIVPTVGLVMTVDIDAATAENLTVPRSATYRLNKTGGFGKDVWDKLDTDTDYITIMDNLVPSEDDPDTYIGYIALEQPELYRDGMTADVSIVTYSAHSAMTLPQDLVKDGKVKILRDGGQVTEVPVETGAITDDGLVEIKSGLTPSDKIVKE